ncbi:MAG: intradiol ring-cleavage dioxygenase [Flavobacteriaceae bacterium]
MNRKHFLKRSLVGLGTVAVLPSFLSACSSDDDDDNSGSGDGTCTVSPSETEGPYPIISPSSYIRANIVGDRTGVAMTLTITVQDKSNGCTALEDVLVDVWHCDKDGNYSQYGSYTSSNFLRGRQTTDSNGQVSFTSIFPGWYSGRAPHIHLEVLSANGNSLLVTQLAFPTSLYNTVYASSGYNGSPDTSNSQDGIFSNSLDENMIDSSSGSVSAGYTILKTITVA